VVLLHENEKDIYGGNPQRCLDIVESLGSVRLRLLWDPANVVQCGPRPFTDGCAALRPYLDYLHIKDAVMATGAVIPAGEGDGELSQTVGALYADGFDGFFSREPHLGAVTTMGGFSGADLFTAPTRAFTQILAAQGVPCAVATIRFAGGALGVIPGTTSPHPGRNVRLQIHADRGSAIIDDDQLIYFHAATDSETVPDLGAGSPGNQAAAVRPAEVSCAGPRTAGLEPTSHTAQHQDFLSSVANDHSPLVTVAEARRTLAVLRAVHESADAGRPMPVVDVDLPDAQGSGDLGQSRSASRGHRPNSS
jgi:Oxidoreductase family, C-terminal alpha/beta domain